MIRSNNNRNLIWSVKPSNTTGKEIYEYDYTESFWMVDKELFDKTDFDNQRCTISYNDMGIRKFKEVKCTDWYFYLCERLGRRPTMPSNFNVHGEGDSKWLSEYYKSIIMCINAKDSFLSN